MPLGTGREALETLFLAMPLKHFVRYFQIEKIQSKFSNEDFTSR